MKLFTTIILCLVTLASFSQEVDYKAESREMTLLSLNYMYSSSGENFRSYIIGNTLNFDIGYKIAIKSTDMGYEKITYMQEMSRKAIYSLVKDLNNMKVFTEEDLCEFNNYKFHVLFTMADFRKYRMEYFVDGEEVLSIADHLSESSLSNILYSKTN